MIITLPILFNFLLKQDAIAIALWPFIFIKYEALKSDPCLVNHERIHLQQQIEMGVIFFYVFYVIEFLFHYIKYRNINLAYFSISFEKEAFANDKNLTYLKQRKFWAWRKYLKMRKSKK